MKCPSKLILLTSLLAASGMLGCDDDTDDSPTCGLTESSCLSANKTLDADKCECVDKGSSSQCGITQAMCESANKTLDANKCECVDKGSQTQTCQVGQHIYNNGCEDDSINACGDHNNDCSKMVDGWKSGTCQTGICKPLSCVKNMHLENDKCVDDDVEHCGETQVNCPKDIAGWKNGYCINGQCQLTSCQPGFYVSGTTCATDSNSCCGDSCKTCKPNEVCSSGSCTAECDYALTYCAGQCFNTTSDVNHCGSCDNDCNATKPKNAKTMNCLESQCVITTCEDGYMLQDSKCVPCDEVEGYRNCGGKCMNIKDDNDNCGECGNSCGTDTTCSKGKCVGNTYCSTGYFDTSSSIDHCGACNNRCPDGQTCIKGECQLGYGKAYCGTEKVLIGDIDRCGGCDDKCAQSLICKDNKCVEGVGPAYCYNVATNTLHDVSNCGKCGKHCEGKICTDGKCVDGQGDMYCNDILINSLIDSANCGGCDISCAVGLQCTSSSCQKYSSSSSASIICNGKGINPYSDSKNCGKCGTVCGDGKTCQAGVCTYTPSSTWYCSGKTVYPYNDSSNCGGCGNNCGTGKYCYEGVCKSDKPYSSTTTYCNGTKVYPYKDSSNCGGCGNVCENGKDCAAGVCALTASTTKVCSGKTVYPYNDSSNCGGCGNNCGTGKYCYEGVCKSDKPYSSTTTYCNGTKVYPYKDSSNCGGCGNVCENGKDCVAGVCTYTPSSTWSCSGKTVYPYNDSSNCGVCGNNCGTGKYCYDGVCKSDKPYSSTTTYCNGTKVYPYNDSSNCGGCGNTCSTKKCLAGSCGKYGFGDTITFGHYEQDNDTTNGKEPIEWRILDKNSSGQYLVISEKALDVKRYNTTYISITWEKSTIRSWLNGYGASTNTVGTNFSSDNFIDTAFTTEEKAKIVTDPGNATTDKIFLLSITEAQTYFSSDADRQADATRYVVKKGAYVRGSESDKYSSGGSCTDVHCYSLWWLRSPGFDYNYAASVLDDGSINDFGDYVTYDIIAVRPALWVNL